MTPPRRNGARNGTAVQDAVRIADDGDHAAARGIISAKLDHLCDIISGLSEKQDEMAAKVDALTSMKPDLAEFLELYRPARGVLIFGKWAGKVLMWFGGLIVAIGGTVAVVKGWLPK